MLCADELTKVNGGVSETFHGLCLAADGIRDAIFIAYTKEVYLEMQHRGFS